LELALSGRKIDFSKVIKMIEDMIALLSQEQAEDEHKKEYCTQSIDSTEDKVKTLARDSDDLESSIEERKAAIKELTDDINTLKAGIDELDRSVADATSQRKKENNEFIDEMSSNNAAKDLLEFAKSRLHKFYAPKLALLADSGGHLASVGGTMFAGKSLAHARVFHADEPAPETWGAYQKKTEESMSVISMMELLIRDLEKEMSEAQTQEEMSQKAYEELMHDSASKRAADLKSIRIKLTSKVDSEERKDPPIQTEYLRSGGATTLIFMVEGAKAVNSLVMRSPMPANMVVPPERTTLP